MIRAPRGLLTLENEVFEIRRCRAGEIDGLSLTGHARVENPNHLLDADTALLACPGQRSEERKVFGGAWEWQRSELTDVTAMVVIYEAFVEGRANSKLPSTLPAACVTSTSSPSMRSSNREQSGVSPIADNRG
jgi:hypothetical protein